MLLARLERACSSSTIVVGDKPELLPEPVNLAIRGVQSGPNAETRARRLPARLSVRVFVLPHCCDDANVIDEAPFALVFGSLV